MTARHLQARLFGRDIRFTYSERWLGYALVLLRIAMGWVLFQGGIVKVLDPSWSAAGYLNNAIPEGNPLSGLWPVLGSEPWIGIMTFLNQWGLTLTGLGLMLGALVRWNAFWGSIMMLFYWLAALEGGILQGLPVDHGWIIDSHIVYIILLFGLGAFGAGRIIGVDAYLEQTTVVKRSPWLRSFLG